MRHVRSIRSASRFAAIAATIALVFGGGAPVVGAHGSARPAQAAAARPVATRTITRHDAVVAAATLPPTTCVPGCDLYAKTGSLTLAGGGTVPIWGYAANAVDPAGLPGPTIIVTQGTSVTITLHNVDVPGATSLGLSQLPLVPDTTGVTAGGAKAYTFTPGTPGTFLYEAGLTPNGPRQVAMGLVGALVVRPSACPGCAYDATSAFDDESLLVLSEIDPALNADPLAFNMPDYHPTYWLINGASYPNTAQIDSAAGHHVLLRYVNAGLRPHSMSLLGAHQAIVGVDGRQSRNPMTLVAETIAAGSSIDALVAVSPTAPAGARYAIFDAATHLDNNGTLGTAGPSPADTPVAFGGMMTFISLAGGGGPGSPTTSAVQISPSISNGLTNATLTATIDAHGGATVAAAEWFVDAIGADGSGCAFFGGFGAATASVSATVPAVGGIAPCVGLASLSSGNHTFFVHGRDSNGVWGVVGSAVLNLDKTGPAVSGLAIAPAVTNGAVDVALSGTASDAASGGSDVTAAEYAIDGGTPTAITLGTPATTVSLSATIAAATVNGLTAGPHAVGVRAQDSLGNWGAVTATTLTIDKAGPTATGVSVTPNPTNTTFGVQGGTGGGFAERIDATVSDVTSGNHDIVAAEYFVDVVGASGTGGRMIPVVGTFNAPTSAVYGLIDLYTMSQFADGTHTIYVHAKDAAGNWGTTATGTVLIDRVSPTFTSLSASPNPTNAGNSNNVAFTLTAVGASDASAGVGGGEWWEGTDPGQGNGTAFTGTSSTTINFVSLGWARGNHTVFARIKDAAHNWSTIRSVVVNIVYPNTIFADGFESGTFSAWSSRGGNLARTSVSSGAAQAGTFKMVANVSGGTSGYVQDNSPFVDTSYHARFYFNPNSLTVNTTGRTIFLGLGAANQNVFQVQLRRTGTTYQVSAIVNRSGGTTATSWFTIPNNAYSAIEIAWASGGSTSFRLSIGGVVQQTLTGLNTSAFTLETVRLGPQGNLGGVSGSVRFDAFASTRNTTIGP